MSDRRIRAMARTIESALNANRLKDKIDPKSMKEYMTSMKDLEQRLYWEKLHYTSLMQNYNQYYDKFFENEIEKLPGYLKLEYEISIKQVKEAKQQNSGLAEDYNPENLYFEQTMRLNSEEDARRIALQYRVRKLIEQRLMDDE